MTPWTFLSNLTDSRQAWPLIFAEIAAMLLHSTVITSSLSPVPVNRTFLNPALRLIKGTPDTDSNRSNLLWMGLVLLAMVGVGVISRMELTGLPNVKPLAAMALFAAFYFRSAWMPCAALLSIMLVSDWCLGTYDWQVTAAVYISLMVSCWLGSRIGKSAKQVDASRVAKSQTRTSNSRLAWAGPRLILASIFMSTSFFVLTNGMVWLVGQWYPPTFSGLVSCYLAGVPFYRLTLFGDLAFTVGGLAVWQTANAWNAARTNASVRALLFR